MEWSSEEEIVYFGHAQPITFQSLFWWNDLLRLYAAPVELGHRTGFNPCSDGMIFWGAAGCTLQARCGVLFQSLFWWNDLLRERCHPRRHKLRDVSILVLMEWSSEASRHCMSNWPRTGFQSLFWWNDLLRSHGKLKWSYSMTVSILVLMEWSSEASLDGHAIIPRVRVSILVLMEWSSEEPLYSVGKHIQQRSFNPCSDGMIFWGSGLFQSISAEDWGFNPCSDGMIFWGLWPQPFCWALAGFQSLFWWNDLLRRVMVKPLQMSRRGFNPCSDGMIFWGRQWRCFWWCLSSVSILVLMEWSSEVSWASSSLWMI